MNSRLLETRNFSTLLKSNFTLFACIVYCLLRHRSLHFSCAVVFTVMLTSIPLAKCYIRLCCLSVCSPWKTFRTCDVIKQRYTSEIPILVTEHWAWSWSRCTDSPQVTISRPPGGRLLLFSARPAVTFPAAEHHRLLAGTKLYCLVTEAHRCEQLAEGCYAALPRVEFESTTCWLRVQCCTRCATILKL